MKSSIINSRVIAGELKGREIKSPADKATHPMGSRERLALMNSLGLSLKGATVLDAFSGTGAVGIEALSRGARSVTFVEKNKKTINVLRENIKNLGLVERSSVYESAVEKIDFNERFDLVIADPPYDLVSKINPVTFIKLAKLSKGYFVLSHPATFDPHQLGLNLISTKAYANARISTFTLEK